MVRRAEDKPGDGGTEERMCERAAGTSSQSGTLSCHQPPEKNFTCVTRFKLPFVKRKASENMFLQSGPPYPGEQQPSGRPEDAHSFLDPCFDFQMKTQPELVLVAAQI